ncbi:hypothetical protein P691DRAFT_422938 [Macrolepiota fuliginosa MF-IS2]|uniref:LsmAD domain-containing protein n=1 Tax=Macrolepiota fuliginosa MF-IS2 TaxID=1400762 RepID=A0A9P5XGB9_9AGAR|nr:hypothetical protein P691DRAFT_422938 [Macrolepiota fuliginosa MF-IS2]
MATTSRQTKPPRKGGPDSARRPAWSGPRASPTFSPPSSSPRSQPAAPPPPPGPLSPLAQPNGARPDNPRDRILQSLAGLTGTTVTLTTKTAVRYEGVVGSTSSEGDTIGVTLKDVKDLMAPGAPLKDSIFIASTNIESYTSGPADAKPANGDTFRTDTDISQKKANAGRERELQAWLPDSDVPLMGPDDDTFGAIGNTSWDQFAVNEKLFGVTGGFVEDEYTTKLDRSAADFKERELKAQRIAAEILGATTNNPHIKEERGIDDSGANEEDKYGAVVRGQNAYIPPGARRGIGGALSPPSSVHIVGPPPTQKQEVPKVSINGPDGTTVAQNPSPPDKTPSPAPGTASAAKDAPAAFRDFVTTEKQRLTRKRQALVKSEMDKRMAELVKFSQSFKLNKPIPDDLVPILAKDEEKQRLIKEKAKKDAESNQARAIGASTAVTASRGVGVTTHKGGIKPAVTVIPKPTAAQTPAIAQKPSAAGPTASKSETAVKKIPMFIQSIPPFKGSRVKPTSTSTTPNITSASANGANGNATPATTATTSPVPMSPTTTSANRLNVNASSFRPNLKGTAPNTAVPSTTTQNVASPKPKQPEPVVHNPFFGVRPIKKSSVTHIKDDFSPFKNSKVAEPNQIAPSWPYHGKRYIQMFPTAPHPPPHPTHMVPPVPPPMPPPSYEEDSAAQAAAAARGYVYPYPPYGYPSQVSIYPQFGFGPLFRCCHCIFLYFWLRYVRDCNADVVSLFFLSHTCVLLGVACFGWFSL